ncbi:hypothetical protein C8F01DRAFT_1231260 [Mycena amicta]|nr:hypothetical protein C8F01DRAFT_1231260 [Mycena amicta]
MRVDPMQERPGPCWQDPRSCCRFPGFILDLVNYEGFGWMVLDSGLVGGDVAGRFLEVGYLGNGTGQPAGALGLTRTRTCGGCGPVPTGTGTGTGLPVGFCLTTAQIMAQLTSFGGFWRNYSLILQKLPAGPVNGAKSYVRQQFDGNPRVHGSCRGNPYPYPCGSNPSTPCIYFAWSPDPARVGLLVFGVSGWIYAFISARSHRVSAVWSEGGVEVRAKLNGFDMYERKKRVTREKKRVTSNNSNPQARCVQITLYKRHYQTPIGQGFLAENTISQRIEHHLPSNNLAADVQVAKQFPQPPNKLAEDDSLSA